MRPGGYTLGTLDFFWGDDHPLGAPLFVIFGGGSPKHPLGIHTLEKTLAWQKSLSELVSMPNEE